MDKKLREQYLRHAVDIIKVIAWHSFNDVADQLEAAYGERPEYIGFSRRSRYGDMSSGWAEIKPVSAGLRAEIDRWISAKHNDIQTDADYFYMHLNQEITRWADTVGFLRWFANSEPPEIPALEFITVSNVDMVEALRGDIETVSNKLEAAKATVSAMKRVLDSVVEGENA